jgi:hypothetical protein
MITTYFQRFSPIFGEKNRNFLKPQWYGAFHPKFGSVLSQPTPIFWENFLTTLLDGST